jgi:UDP-glucose 4-epimerase
VTDVHTGLIAANSRFLVTGGAGFIGSHLVERLLELGMRVRVVDDLSTGRRSNIEPFLRDIEFVEGSLADSAVATRACADCDYVLHQAAIPSVPRSVRDPRGTHEASTTATMNVLEGARAAGVRRVIYAASSSAYGNADVAVKTEGLVPQPLSPYAAAKLAGEHYLRAWHNVYGLETVSLRYFNVFGPRQDPTSEYSAVIPRFITAALRGEAPVIYGDGTQSRDFTYVANNVEANLLACVAPLAPGKVMNIACGGSYSLLDLVGAISRILGKDIQPRFEPARVGDVMHSLAGIDLARGVLGYSPKISFEDGLRHTIDFYRGE